MGALMGVAQGSEEPAQFIILEYNGERTDLDTYVVVGKGITFDSGGISIKPSEGMEAMKDDMSGAAVTLGVLRAVALLGVAASRHRPDPRHREPAQRPSLQAGGRAQVDVRPDYRSDQHRRRRASHPGRRAGIRQALPAQGAWSTWPR